MINWSNYVVKVFKLCKNFISWNKGVCIGSLPHVKRKPAQQYTSLQSKSGTPIRKGKQSSFCFHHNTK